MAQVTMPDGAVVEMPDDLDPALGARLRKFQQAQSTPAVQQAQSTPAARPDLTFGSTLAGEGELAATAAGNLIPNAVNSVVDLYHRITGQGPDQKGPVPTFHAGQAAQNLVRDVGELPPAQAVGGALKSADTALGNISPTLRDVVHQAGGVTGDVLNVLGAASLPNAVRGVVGDVGNAVAGIRALGEPTAGGAPTAADVGLRTGTEAPIARTLAGSSAKPALQVHNQQVGNVIAATEAGHPWQAPMSYDSLATAREGPSSVFNRVAASLPEGQLDPQAQAGIQSAGQPQGGRMSAGSPQAQQQIEALRAQLLDPTRTFTGEQIVNESRGLRQEGFHNIASDDVSNQQLGHAQLDMANAIEGHIGRNLPTNGPVSLDQFQQARQALAKNYTVQAALRGNNVDMTALARVQRADPQLLSGGLQTLADFANANTGAAAVPNPLQEPSLGKDIANISLTKPASWVAPVVDAGARRALTGSTDAAIQQALSAFPPRAPGTFGRLPPGPLRLEPPPGSTGVTPVQRQWELPPGEGRPSVSGPEPGFSLAEMLAPQGAAPSPGGSVGSGSVGSLADVMSQGVPEGLVARTAPRGPLTNNASGESAASAEAINRGTRPLVEIDPDGNEKPILRDVTQADVKAPKGHLILDSSTGEIIDRGGLNERLANGLRNRWAALSGQRLGDTFVMQGR